MRGAKGILGGSAAGWLGGGTSGGEAMGSVQCQQREGLAWRPMVRGGVELRAQGGMHCLLPAEHEEAGEICI